VLANFESVGKAINSEVDRLCRRARRARAHPHLYKCMRTPARTLTHARTHANALKTPTHVTSVFTHARPCAAHSLVHICGSLRGLRAHARACAGVRLNSKLEGELGTMAAKSQCRRAAMEKTRKQHQVQAAAAASAAATYTLCTTVGSLPVRHVATQHNVMRHRKRRDGEHATAPARCQSYWSAIDSARRLDIARSIATRY
jgi:hypothetical protein